MPLTPAEVRDVSFSKPPVGKPGYHPGEVDELLDRVHAELTRLIEDNHNLRSQVQQLDQQRRAGLVDPTRHHGPLPCPEPVMPPLRPPITESISPGADHDLRAVKVFILAQKMADQLREQAHAQADRMLTQARAHCAQLLADARVTAQDIINQARTRVETLSDARTTAETRQRQSPDQAASLEQNAARQHAQILDALHQDKRLLENTIEDLRGFEQTYRRQLATYLQSLIHQLDGPECAAPADPIRAPQDLVGTGLGTRGEAGQSPPRSG